MKNRIIISLIAFMVIMSIAATFSSAYAIQTYSYNKPSYYGQYNFNSNYAARGYGYVPVNAWSRGGNPYYFNTYPARGSGPYTMSSTSCNPIIGCRTVADSHMYVRNALDYAYFKNPSLLAPRYIDNHQRYYRGLWPQGFYY